jgi:hypothetical protein
MILSFVMAMVLTGNAPEMMIPEGTVIPVVLNEKLSTTNVQESDPILFSLADDIRASGHRGIILIPRGSSVVGRIVRSDRAGHFIGRAMMDIRMEKIVTPDGDVYDGLNTKVVDVNKSKGEKGQIKTDGEIEGPVHRKRDAFLLLFPPTTLFQLMALPARGPDVVLPPETRLYIKLMTPIYVERQGVAQASVPMQMPMPMQAPAAAAIPAPMPVPMPAQVPAMAPATLPAPAPVLTPRYVVPAPVTYLSWQEIDRIVSPIALYPDAVLYQVLAACRDSNFQALYGYPDLVRRMSGDMTWVSSVGQAYRFQPNDVLNSVQRLRLQSRGFYRGY